MKKRQDHTSKRDERVRAYKSAGVDSASEQGGVAPFSSRSRVGVTVDRATASNSFAVVMLILLVMALVGVAIHAVLFPREGKDIGGATSVYNWDYLKKEDGRFSYVINGETRSCTGIDVSEHQGYIDWDRVAGDGISFAFVRVGNRGLESGKLSQDSYFEYNSKAAREAGLDVGAYFFSQATTEEEAIEEADFVIERLRGRDITYPVAYDHERISTIPGRADGLTPEQMTRNAEAFCARIQEAGYTPMIYGSVRDLFRYNLPDLARYNIWLARYNVSAPTFNQYFSFWQYTNEGTVAGVDGNVDLNIQFLVDRNEDE